MSKSLKIISNAKTHVGNKRAVNQDAFLAQPEIGVWIVADGMGGHHNGEYASGLVTQKIMLPDNIVGFDQTVDFIKAFIRKKNTELFYYAKKVGNSVRCGTTVVALVMRGNKVAILWVGDSRIYRFDPEFNQLSQVTVDHTVFNSLKQKGLVDEFHPMAEQYKEALARVVGGEEDVVVDEYRLVLKKSERFLLCSDGINKELSDADLAAILSRSEAPGVTCDMMIKEALANVGRDNMTACVIDVIFI
ncbi:PP2C family protein-serine/threonine phosphatase [Francisella philomiragia]|uniref:Phosphatase 2C family protein n=1 Tax=Francisella philomiragia TaxID=28110 RepID=A0A0B6CU01_9GAMM|nr:PP2C family serine/threonine-protein phosphatase [Francisella philomiragia]AJI53924.1 phosphatase 2C family protein [Francisella philomiragia]MBY7735061.1 serine/threonine-protein phosphatase [Francisella philomiragia]